MNSVCQESASASKLEANESDELWLSRGDELFHQRQVADALVCYERALSINKDAQVHGLERWICCMLLGDFESAWCESDRIGRNRKHNDPFNNHVFWDGNPVNGKRVLVRCLHGLGDTIQYARFLPLLRYECDSVILKAQPQLLELFGTDIRVDELCDAFTDRPDPKHDVEVEIMELAYLLRINMDGLPQPPYLRSPCESIAKAAPIFAGEKRRKIGLLWSSSAYNPARSIPLKQFVPLLDNPDLALYSLQCGVECYPLQGELVGRLIDLRPHIQTITQTAAMIMNLDLVISVDTMVAHLAGALGKPVWVLLQSHADWRWMLERSDSPWYPTMRLFRQPVAGDWKSVIGQVVKSLAESSHRTS